MVHRYSTSTHVAAQRTRTAERAAMRSVFLVLMWLI